MSKMKNIILLSDGTGNSAAKQHRTNVWHLYQALDLPRDDQIAFYNDGVGSQNFLLFKILGGVFGWGLKNNVVELYKILCRNYKQNDKIYLFGFSRGAFTVRMLAGMIAEHGLYICYTDEDDLRRVAQAYFVTYREKYNRGWLTRPFRWLWFCWQRRLICDNHHNSYRDIEFIGVWDTVEAYGFPIKELVVIWDWLIFPLRFVDQIPSKNIKRACHALSIDDERHSFHPVLWEENSGHSTNEGKIEQVWFAGVHSDVGGGYPRNNLALVTLDWMISKVEESTSSGGLQFISEIREQYRHRCDWHGVQNDSRSGFRAYYRYKPREIKRISEKMGIKKPKIHRGVLERIKLNIVPYAPLMIPVKYEVVVTQGNPVSQSEYETDSNLEFRENEMAKIFHVVIKRRWLYHAFVLATAIFALWGCYLIWSAGGADGDWVGFAHYLYHAAIYALSDFLDRWLQILRQNPWSLWLTIVTITSVILLRLKTTWYRATQARAMAAWARLNARNK